MKKIKIVLLSMILTLSSLFATEYEVDKEISLVTFKIRHAVVAKVEGKFNIFSATYEYDDTLNYFKSFEAEVDMASVDTDEKYRDKHLKEKVFDVLKYPKMTLKLMAQDGTSFKANLTIKGITKEVEFTIFLSPKQEKTFILSSKISRKDFNLKFSDMAEMGGVAVGDTIEINVLFSGVKRG